MAINSTQLTGGDDLDDDLDLQDDYMPPSDAEEPAVLDDGEMDSGAGKEYAMLHENDRYLVDEEEGGAAGEAYFSDEEGGVPVASAVSKGKKRKVENNADEEDDDVQDSGDGTNQGNSEENKKKKRKLASKARKEKRKAAEEAALQPSQMSVQELDEFLYASLRTAYPKSTGMELAEIRIPVNAVQSTSSYTGSRDLAAIPEFISSQIPPLPKKLKKPGTPSIIILSPSGIRSADMVRALKEVNLSRAGGDGEEEDEANEVGGGRGKTSGKGKGRGKNGELKPPGEVAKLFAKHFKVSEQIEHLEKTKIWAAVGTPGRIGKILADSDALKIRQQTVILLDLSYKDSKNRTLLSIPEIRDEFWRILFGNPVVRTKLLGQGVKFAVF